MAVRLLIILFVLSSFFLNSQNVSSVFLDYVNITVNGREFYSSSNTSLKFMVNNKDVSLTIYKDSVYKLNINFTGVSQVDYGYLTVSGAKFFCHDTLYPLFHVDASDYEDCSETSSENYSLQNWPYNANAPAAITQIKLHYRLVNLAPKDTTNYSYNYRQGLWVGKDRHGNKVAVNYNNDKKHGLATVFYNDSTSYNVNYSNNHAPDYGIGFWQRYGQKTGFKFNYSITGIVAYSCYTEEDSTYESFSLVKRNKVKVVSWHSSLSIYSFRNNVDTVKATEHINGNFLALTRDTLILSSDLDTSSNGRFIEVKVGPIAETVVKIPIKNINKLYYSRDGLQDAALKTNLLAAFTGLIVSPLISIQKNGFNKERFKTVSGISAGVLVLSITINATFGQKGFLIHSPNKKKKVWIIH